MPLHPSPPQCFRLSLASVAAIADLAGLAEYGRGHSGLPQRVTARFDASQAPAPHRPAVLPETRRALTLWKS